MEAIAFNPAQMHMLSMLSRIKSEQALEQLKEQLAEFYARMVDEEMEELWNSDKWNEKKLQELKESHLRTPYK